MNYSDDNGNGVAEGPDQWHLVIASEFISRPMLVKRSICICVAPIFFKSACHAIKNEGLISVSFSDATDISFGSSKLSLKRGTAGLGTL